MKLGIMQPYFFPYSGYFALIRRTDQWVVFDTVQYIRHGWMNRNRILHPKEGWQYIIVPLEKHAREVPICDSRIAQNWQRKIIGQLQHYRKQAPYFTETVKLVESCLETSEISLARMNVYALAQVCKYLGIEFKYQFFSKMDLEIGPVNNPGDWALRIAVALGADEYINPPGGESLFDSQQFEHEGIRLTILHKDPFTYETGHYQFVPNLSILDALMWNSPVEVVRYLDA